MTDLKDKTVEELRKSILLSCNHLHYIFDEEIGDYIPGAMKSFNELARRIEEAQQKIVDERRTTPRHKVTTTDLRREYGRRN